VRSLCLVLVRECHPPLCTGQRSFAASAACRSQREPGRRPRLSRRRACGIHGRAAQARGARLRARIPGLAGNPIHTGSRDCVVAVQDPDDHKRVIEEIDRELPLPAGAAAQDRRDLLVGAGSQRLVPIGSIYCLRSNTSVSPPAPALYYSAETTEQLELLAASMQSKVIGRRARARTRSLAVHAAARHAYLGRHRLAQNGTRARAGGTYGQRLCRVVLQPRVGHFGLHRTGAARMRTRQHYLT
jgi:hypothetical protein